MIKTLRVIGFTIAMSAANSSVSASENPMVGRWIGSLTVNPQGFKVQQSFDFKETEGVQTVKVTLENPPLRNRSMLIQVYFDYSLGAPLAGLPNTVEFDQQFTKLTMTYLSQILVDDANRDKECGFSDWELGVEKDITGIKCRGGVEPIIPGTMFYQIANREGSGLKVGFVAEDDDITGTTSEARPKSIDNATVYLKVK